MARIRDDLDGSVFLHGAPGGPVILFAGDVVPEGSEVGAHLLATDEVLQDDDASGDDFTQEGGAADESGDPAPTEDSVPEVEPEPADDGASAEPTPIPAKRAARQAKA